MRVATYNIHGCVGIDRRRKPERIAEVIASLEADIIGLQEVEGRKSRSKIDQAQYLAGKLGLDLVEGPLLLEGKGGYGNALLTRYPVLDVERRVFQRPGSQTRGLIDARLDVPWFGPLRVIVTHLEVRDHRIRSTQLREIKHLIDDGERGPTVLLGDLNEWWNRRLALRSLDRTVHFLHSPATFPARLPLLRLDRIAVRGLQSTDHDNRARRIESRLTRLASDHLPLVAELEPVEPEAADNDNKAGLRPSLKNQAPADQDSASSSRVSTPLDAQ
jgi:endonuclease/exonuclease/phosphatase family metal-dependent hydrolase